MADPIIRTAEDADMPALRGDVGAYFELFDLWPDTPDTPDFLDAERAFGNLLVGEVDGRIVGFGGTLRRGALTHLGDLFVLPEHQSSGVGRMILAELLPRDSPVITFASDDERALGLYVRSGMRPRCPLFYLEGAPGNLARLGRPRPEGGNGVSEAGSGIWEVTVMDAIVSGGDRAECLAWYAGLPGVAVSVGRTGYAFARMIGDEVLVGPAGGETPQNCVDAVLDAVAAHPDAELAQVAVPGMHPLLPLLIEAGWLIDDMDTLMISEDGLVCLDRYVPHHDLG